MSDVLEATARQYDAVATELELAVKHCRVAARHFRDELVPRGTAHAWAARGHILRAEGMLDEQAQEHASHSVPTPD